MVLTNGWPFSQYEVLTSGEVEVYVEVQAFFSCVANVTGFSYENCTATLTLNRGYYMAAWRYQNFSSSVEKY